MDALLVIALVAMMSYKGNYTRHAGISVRVRTSWSNKVIGMWRSLVSHLIWDQGSAGSSPVIPRFGKDSDCNVKADSLSVSLPLFKADCERRQLWEENLLT